MTLKPAIPFLGLAQLRDFKAQQDARLETVSQSLKRGQTDIDKIKQDAVRYSHATTKMIGNTPVVLNDYRDKGLNEKVVAQQSLVRTNIDLQLRPVMAKMLAAKTTAVDYQTRHWTKPQVLNRAGGSEGVARKAHLAVIFKQSGKAQLFDFGQFAVDTADAVLGDALHRAVADMATNERPFQPAQLIELIRNGEFDEANLLLSATVEAYSQAKRGIDIFNTGRTGQVTTDQIIAGLNQRAADGVETFNLDDVVDASGAIREDALVSLAQRTK